MADNVTPQVNFTEAQVTTLNLQLAGLGSRILAILVDGICLSIIASIFGFNSFTYVGGALAYNGQGMFILYLAYVIGFWIWKAATPGKMLLGIKIVEANGQNITPVKAVLRYVGYLVSGAIFGLGFLWAFFDGKKQGWHDKIAGTYVVKAK